jgi:putative zinc finger/helix-turn-helix YgiT family protein
MTTPPEKPRATALAEDACPQCGTTMKIKHGTLRIAVNGEDVAVPRTAHLGCPKCGEVVLRLEDARRLSADAVALCREKQGLLSASEIRAIRKRFGLTQADLARLLHLGLNTVSRWEAGRKLQTEAMDVLLRLLRDVPGNLEYLREHAA